MSVSIEEIKGKTFPTAAKDGYYKKAVNKFLDETAETISQLLSDKKALEELLAESEAKLQETIQANREEIARLTAENEELHNSAENTNVESEAIAQALIAAQRTGIEIERAARERAEQTRIDAEALAAEIVATAEAERDEINREAAEIVVQREKERADFIGMLDRLRDRSIAIADEYRAGAAPSELVLQYVSSDIASELGWENGETEVEATAADDPEVCEVSSESDVALEDENIAEDTETVNGETNDVVEAAAASPTYDFSVPDYMIRPF